MTWYAVRTAPGAQMPQREYTAETTKSRKGYRIVTSLDPRQSAVEKALTAAGFVHYMPAEKRLQRDRLRPFLWKSRRFALMVGYVFVLVEDGDNTDALQAVAGVAGVVRGMDGRPLPIPLSDIMVVRSAEARAEAEFDRQSRQARQAIRKAAKAEPSLQKIVDMLDVAGTITVPVERVPVAA